VLRFSRCGIVTGIPPLCRGIVPGARPAPNTLAPMFIIFGFPRRAHFIAAPYAGGSL